MRTLVRLALAVVATGLAVQATAEPTRLTGKVLEKLDASSYTYVRLETADGEAWAAVPRADLEIGAQVVVGSPQLMSGFESRSLGRSFETIYFGTLAGGGEKPHAAKPVLEPEPAVVEVAKAEGANGRTVAELYEQRADLSGKPVTLRGRVVKYSAGIMGRNWIHLQDGTGDAKAGTHDITVTTSDSTAVGEIILVQGTVTLDKDFGMGYRYAVIVEEASLQ
jgi:hypothetical protein